MRQFGLWAAIHLVGLAVDIAVAACGARITIGLQMSSTKKIFTIMVFSCGIL